MYLPSMSLFLTSNKMWFLVYYLPIFSDNVILFTVFLRLPFYDLISTSKREDLIYWRGSILKINDIFGILVKISKLTLIFQIDEELTEILMVKGKAHFFSQWDEHRLIQWWQTAPAAGKNLNIFFKCCSKYKFRDSFEICSSWRFQNTPNILKLIEFWLRYMRSKTNDMILKNSFLTLEGVF